MNIQEFLGRHSVEFKVLEHRETYDAQHMAQAVHVSGHEVAKTVLLRTDGEHDYVVAVLPATYQIDFDKAARAFSCSKVTLATEVEIAQRCADCEIGALPPFGSHYGMKTFVDESLTEDEQIAFEGLTHTETIRMKYDDFAQLEKPLVASFCSKVTS